MGQAANSHQGAVHQQRELPEGQPLESETGTNGSTKPAIATGSPGPHVSAAVRGMMDKMGFTLGMSQSHLLHCI